MSFNTKERLKDVLSVLLLIFFIYSVITIIFSAITGKIFETYYHKYPECNYEVSAFDKFCEYCGDSVENELYVYNYNNECSDCGATIKHKYCSNCGNDKILDSYKKVDQKAIQGDFYFNILKFIYIIIYVFLIMYYFFTEKD